MWRPLEPLEEEGDGHQEVPRDAQGLVVGGREPAAGLGEWDWGGGTRPGWAGSLGIPGLPLVEVTPVSGQPFHPQLFRTIFARTIFARTILAQTMVERTIFEQANVVQPVFV